MKMTPALNGLATMTDPPIFTWEWRCYGCGRREAGGNYRQPDPNRMVWDIANGENR
jgi:hypothetical protein